MSPKTAEMCRPNCDACTREAIEQRIRAQAHKDLAIARIHEGARRLLDAGSPAPRGWILVPGDAT